ncbi:ABC transporter permease [Urechidicola sp. KH5]
MALETRIYQRQNNKRISTLLKECFTDIGKSLFLAKQLAKRDIKAQYRQSFLGIAWMFITPLFTSLVWIFLSASGTVQLSDTGIPYPLYVFSGTLIWSIIVEAINTPMLVTNASKGIMSKINFPKEGLLLSGIYKMLFNSSVKVLLLIAFVVIYKVGFHTSILWLPLVLLGGVLFGTTIGLFITPVGLLYSDINKIVSIGLRFLMYATPVVYALPKEGIMKTVMELNPITPIVLTARDVIVGFEPLFLNYFLIVVLVSVPLLFIGLLFYRFSIPVIVERIS